MPPEITSNYYLNSATTTSTSTYWENNEGFTYSIPQYGSGSIQLISNKKGISPQLYFSYIKKKLGLLERTKLDRRLKKIEAAFDSAVESGQNVLAEKILTNLARESRESFIMAKGVTKFIERDDLYRHKNNIAGGHISDTSLKDYTRVIPKTVLNKIKNVKDVFDDFVIFHSYDNAAEEKLAKKQKMSNEEKNKMRDPVIFGIIKETDRLYFVADWEDEYCDLTFDKIVEVIGSEKIASEPSLY